ncbi:MAG: iron complex transport system ATP-binding protein, partial [Psychroserpens sp.]
MQNENKNIVLSTNDLSTGYLTKKSESVISNHINIAIQKGLLVGIV